MHSEIGLREETADDRDFLFRLYASTRAAEMAMVAWPHSQKQAFLQQQFNAQHLYYRQIYPHAQYAIIESGGQAAGRLYVHRGDNEMRVIDIALLPEYQRRGIGGSLMRKLLQEAAASCCAVAIHVEHNNPALKLYTRLGFEHVSDEGVYYFMRWSGNASA
jgi:ribosomal protein S18 acetylase RimI-like enzyme